MFLSIVIPAFNEEESLAHTIDEHVRIAQDLKGINGQWEIVCVDDASSDRTWEILNQCAKEHAQVRVLRHVENQGITKSFNHLFQQAHGEFIYLTAADGQWPAENLSVLYECYLQTKADLIIGVRKKRYLVYDPWRTLLSYGFNILAYVSTGFNGQDLNGIKFGRRQIFIEPLDSNSFFGEIERLKKALANGNKVTKAPVIFIKRQAGQAHGAKLKNIFLTIKDIFK